MIQAGRLPISEKNLRIIPTTSDVDFDQLVENGKFENTGKDHFPVVKLFMPGTGCTWLITELLPENPAVAFGLCDLGLGFPELGYIDLDEITQVKNRFGLGVERDLYFKAIYPISVYADAATYCQMITEMEPILNQFVR